MISHHAEVGDGNPVQCQLDQVVVHIMDDDGDWMGQCSSKLEVEVKLVLVQQINVRYFRCSVWGQVDSKQ